VMALLQIADPNLPPVSGMAFFVFTIIKMIVIFTIYMVGVAMLPRGEFAFIIAQEGVGLGVAAQLLYPVAGLSMLVTSVLTSIGLRIIKPKLITAPIIETTARIPRPHVHHRDRGESAST